jgi:CheY-like chemotaxis protein
MEASKRNKVVLIIEDDQDIRDSIEQFLELEGFEVFTAGNGKEGLERLNEIPTPSLILLDLFMPVMGGKEFVEEVKARGDSILGSIPVAILTAAAFHDDEAVMRDPRVGALIRKPIDLDGFLKTIERLCGGEAAA